MGARGLTERSHQAGGDHESTERLLSLALNRATEGVAHCLDGNVALGDQEACAAVHGDRREADHLVDLGRRELGAGGEAGERGGGDQRDERLIGAEGQVGEDLVELGGKDADEDDVGAVDDALVVWGDGADIVGSGQLGAALGIPRG